MNSVTKVNRRDFLKLGAVAGTGLVLGCHIPTIARGAAEPLAAGGFAPNAFLQIDTAGQVTIWVAKSEMGQGVRTSLATLVADELEADWEKVKVEQAFGHPKFGNQGTGGSGSIRSSWEPLRRAGAVGRAMLVTAAAAQWGVDPATCRAEMGAVAHESGKKLTYGELAEAAAKLPVPDAKSVKLKDPKEFRYIGKNVKRIDNPQIVDGTAVYGLDVKVPGMLIAVVARCPVFGGKVATFDDTKAKAVPGVKHVLKIDSGVAVVADNFWNAKKGREALEITWDEGPDAALDDKKIRARFEENLTKEVAVGHKTGDTPAMLKAASRKVEATYFAPFAAHVTMEPMNCTAHVQADKCEVWAPTQFPSFIAQPAAQISGLPMDKIRVNVTLLGGGFGRRAMPDSAIEALQISKAVGAPIKVVWTREDDMQHDYYRPASLHQVSVGLDEKGMPTSWLHRIACPSIGAQLGFMPKSAKMDNSVLEGAKIAYDIPANQVDYAMSNTSIPAGWWRSVHNSQNSFVTESMIDEVAVATKQDPFEFRRKLLEKEPRLKAVLELAAQKAGWGKPLPPGRFRGIAAVDSFGSFAAEVVEISVNKKDGTVRVHRVVAAVDCGTVVNPSMVEAQVQSAIVYGLTAALKGEITIDKGRVQQNNFYDYEMLRMEEMPVIETHIVPSTAPPTGIGEPPLPPIAPAVANAIFAATGKRLRRMPFKPEDIKG